jgi:eukaryotic-like serine/threonine-protein kinase
MGYGANPPAAYNQGTAGQASGPASTRPFVTTQRMLSATLASGPPAQHNPYEAHPPSGQGPSVNATMVPTSGLPSTRVPNANPSVNATMVPTSNPLPMHAPPRPSMASSPSFFQPPPASSPSVGGTLVSGSTTPLTSTAVPTSSPAVNATMVPTSSPLSRQPNPSVVGTRPPIAQGPPVAATLVPSLGVRPPMTPPPGHGARQPAQTVVGGAPAIRYPAPGDVISSMRGNYHVRSEVGRGRYGTVYEVLGPFDQRYALKLIVPANRHYAEVQQEWRREAERLLLLRHPGVVYLHDAFEANYLFYMAFEWCTGSLSDLLVEPLGPELAIELTRQILAATQYLHDSEVVHDDLHSGNVLLTHADRPIIKIADFGISKELRGQAKARPEVVHHAIMAPEVVAAGYTSRQSDIYQVGLLLYWMVTGKPPLDYDVPYNDLVRQVADGLPRQRAEQLGTPIGAVIAKMLRRRDAYRYSSARDVWEELRDVPEWRGRQLFRDTP